MIVRMFHPSYVQLTHQLFPIHSQLHLMMSGFSMLGRQDCWPAKGLRLCYSPAAAAFPTTALLSSMELGVGSW